MLIISPNDLGSYCRDQRKAAKLSQEAISEAISVRQGTVSSLEHSTQSAKIGTLFRVMAELGLEMHLVPKGSPAPTSDEQTEWPEKW